MNAKTQLLLEDIVSNPRKYLTNESIANCSANFYKDFNLITIFSDGIPLARFVISSNAKLVFHTYCSNWLDNHKLSYLANPNGIPHIFSIKDFTMHLKKIKY